jgi:hypothetical protein
MLPCKIVNSIYLAIIYSHELTGNVNSSFPCSLEICNENFIIDTIRLTAKNVEITAILITETISPIKGIFMKVPKDNKHKIIKAIIYNILLIHELYFPKLYFKIFKTLFICNSPFYSANIFL